MHKMVTMNFLRFFVAGVLLLLRPAVQGQSPPECKLTAAGTEYAGTLSVTNRGKTCQRWASDKPHSHRYDHYTTYPEGNAADAKNYCRNPDGDDNGPWCFTMDRRVFLDYCNVPLCPDPCTTNPCQNGGTCSNNAGNAICTCTDGFEGDTCETEQQSCPKPDNIVDATTDCSFPFTYNGQLLYQCTANVSNDCGDIGCYQRDRVWATCTSDSRDHVAENETKSVTIPTTSTVVPLMAVNNWIVIQSRVSAAYPTEKFWANYVNGFGDTTSGDFWLGLEKMYQLTSSASYRLRFELQAEANGKWFSAEYSFFKLGPASDNYRLHTSTTASSDAGDGINGGSPNQNINGMQFTTRDRDNDKNSRTNCAVLCRGGWWYNSCLYGGVNGMFVWFGLMDLRLSANFYLRTDRMMITAV